MLRARRGARGAGLVGGAAGVAEGTEAGASAAARGRRAWLQLGAELGEAGLTEAEEEALSAQARDAMLVARALPHDVLSRILSDEGDEAACTAAVRGGRGGPSGLVSDTAVAEGDEMALTLLSGPAVVLWGVSKAS